MKGSKKEIDKIKGRYRDIYFKSLKASPKTAELWLSFLSIILGSFVVSDALNECFPTLSTGAIKAIFIAVVIVAHWIYYHFFSTRQVDPYTKTENFIGLFNIENIESVSTTDMTGLIDREHEVEQLRQALKDAAEQQTGASVCLMGKSGCGKSTIIYLLQKDSEAASEFFFINVSTHYKSLREYIKRFDGYLPQMNLETTSKFFSINVSTRYKSLQKYIKRSNRALAEHGKTAVIIMDQFERFFKETREVQREIETIIKSLAKAGVVILFSMREEVFLSFLTRFDPNDLPRETTGQSKGILYARDPLLSIGKEHIWICVGDDRSESDSNDTGKTIFDWCKEAFTKDNGQEAAAIFDVVKNMSLIQKEIVLNMLDCERQNKQEVSRLLGKGERPLMERYYDRQLCSTGNFFDASRIMYILSVGRLSNFYFSKTDMRDALCILDSELSAFDQCVEALQNCQLIKQITGDSDNFYEVAHDYIAQSYEIYANVVLSTDVKVSIDEYCAERVNQKINVREGLNEAPAKTIDGEAYVNEAAKRFKRQKRRHTFANIVGAMAAIIGIITYIGIHMSISYSPVDNIADAAAESSVSISREIFNVCQRVCYIGHIPIAELFIALLSLLYIYTFYKNITCLYDGKTRGLLALFYLMILTMGCASIVRSDMWLVFLGIGNAIQGISCLLIGYDKKLSLRGRKVFCSYGWKTVLVGVLLVTLGVVLILTEVEATYAFLLKTLPMVALLLYSFYSHMNREFFYSHREPIKYIMWSKGNEADK